MSAGCAVVFETVVVTTEDGSAFKAVVAYARGESKGGVVILYEIFGVTGQSQSVTRSYVDDGFDAIDAYVTDAAMRVIGRSVPFLNTHRR